MPIENATLENPATEIKPKAKPVSFGDGRYSKLMEECYKDAQVVFALPPKQAEKLARMIGSEFGAMQANNATTGIGQIKFGNVNKDGKVNVKEAASTLKGITMTHVLFSLRTLAWCNDAGKFGVNRGETKWSIDEKLTEWFNEKLSD